MNICSNLCSQLLPCITLSFHSKICLFKYMICLSHLLSCNLWFGTLSLIMILMVELSRRLGEHLEPEERGTPKASKTSSASYGNFLIASSEQLLKPWPLWVYHNVDVEPWLWLWSVWFRSFDFETMRGVGGNSPNCSAARVPYYMHWPPGRHSSLSATATYRMFLLSTAIVDHEQIPWKQSLYRDTPGFRRYGLAISFRYLEWDPECSSSAVTRPLRSTRAIVYAGTTGRFPTIFRCTLPLQQAGRRQRYTVKQREAEAWVVNDPVASFPVVSWWPNCPRMGNETRLVDCWSLDHVADCASRERYRWWCVPFSSDLSASAFWQCMSIAGSIFRSAVLLFAPFQI